MKAVTFQEPGEVRVEDVASPRIEVPTDALVRVTRTAICGSDLHVYRGDIPGVLPGTVMGHEFVGVVEEVGGAVTGVDVGDRVVGPFHVACGGCRACRRADYHQCEEGAVYGYGQAFGDLQGVQAERVRVPYAPVNLREIPEGLSDEDAIFAGDILTTAFGAVRKARLQPGETCAVVGCGPVGLLAVQSALLFGASRVIALDRVSSRAELAGTLGADSVDVSEVNAVTAVQQLTRGEGADVVIEAVGGPETLHLAFDLVRDGGRISAVGVTAEESFDYPLMSSLVRDIEFRIGLANVHRDIDSVLGLLQSGRIEPKSIVSHRLALADAPEGYRLFEERAATKVILEPGEP